MKIFSLKFVIKKVILIFGMGDPFSKKMLMSPKKFFRPMLTNFWPVRYFHKAPPPLQKKEITSSENNKKLFLVCRVSNFEESLINFTVQMKKF